MSKVSKILNKVSIKNKRASFEFMFIEIFMAGIVLKGTEIKSIRMGSVSLTEGYCYFKNGELFVKNINISIYTEGNFYNHTPTQDRKLLLTKKELYKLESKLKDKGLTIIPIHLFTNEKGFAKLEIALAKGKKLYDKRETLKSKDIKRDIQRDLKQLKK